MFWLPPGRFSTTTGCGQTPCRPCAIARAIVSGEPPGVSGTMMRTGRSGKPCPQAKSGAKAKAQTDSHLVIGILSRCCAASLPTRTVGIGWGPHHFTVRGAALNPHPIRLTAIASAFIACAAPSWAQSPEGKAIVDAQCNSCHALSARVGSGYTPEGWKTVLRMMANHGAPIQAEPLPAMTDYLSKTYPVKGRPDAALVPGPTKVSMQAWQAATPGSRPHDPLAARDGSLWYSGQMANKLGRVDPKTGAVKEYPLKTAHSGPHGLVEDKAGNIWYTGNTGALVGKLDPKSGQVTEYKMPDPEAKDPHT